ncbi:MAG: NlpC/P60 family protein [Calditrichaeota bacterium]|nr:MAG: NlpC/P60 family protein [Calditrichota bacterium]
MKHIIVTIVLLLFIGCAANPRYRTGGYEVEPQVTHLDNSPTTSENIRLGLILQSYLGKPYAGSSKYEEGLDCSDFTQSVFRQFNKTQLPRTAAEQYKYGSQIHFNMLRYGDLVFFKTTRKAISHVGVYVGERKFIHVSTSRGVIISSFAEKYWSERFVGARRVFK